MVVTVVVANNYTIFVRLTCGFDAHWHIKHPIKGAIFIPKNNTTRKEIKSMRKEITFTHHEKRKLLTAALTVTLSISALFIGRAVQKATYNQHTYPLSTVVECINGNEVTTRDFNGNLWVFTDNSEDWFKGDICSLIMHDNYTDIIYDDTIIKAQYSGFVR